MKLGLASPSFSLFASLITKGLAVCSSFILSLVLANYLGPEGSGVFYLFFTLVLIFSAITRLGADQSLVKVINSRGQSLNIAFGLSKMLILSLAFISFITSLILWFYSFEIATWLFKKPELEYILNLMPIATVSATITGVISVLFQSIKKPITYIFYISLFVPLLTAALALILKPNNPIYIIQIFTISSVICTLIATIHWFKFCEPREVNFCLDFSFYDFFKFTLPYWVFAIILLVNQWVGQLIVARYLELSDVGIYSIAQRVSLVFSSLTVAVNAVFSAKIIELIHTRKKSSLVKLLKSAFIFLLVLGGGALLLLILFPSEVLKLFGEGFTNAKDVLVVMSITQFLALFGNLLIWVLSGYGKEKLLKLSVILMFLTNVILSLISVGAYGLDGVAFSQLAAMILYLCCLIYFVGKELNDTK